MVESVYFDACLFIELLQQADKERFDACDCLRLRAKKEELRIVTSTLTIAEVCKLKSSDKDYKAQSQKILEFFEHEYFAIRPLDRQTAELANGMPNEFGLSPMDSIHVATAIVNRVSVMYTYDSAKGRRKGLLTHNLKIGSPPMRIELPPDPSKGTLFDADAIEANRADEDILPIESGKRVG